jgi:methyl-accepting chemotaxis protein
MPQNMRKATAKRGAFMLKSLKISTRIWIPVAILALNVLIVIGLGAQALWDSQMDGRMDKVRAIALSGQSIVEHFYQLETSGAMTHQQAQQAALAALRAYRYDGDGYLSTYLSDGTIISHGVRPDLEGKSSMDLKDANGLPLVKLMIEAAHRGGGFVDYLWERTPGQPTEKVAYAVEHKPWGWVVSTGLYLSDLQQVFISKALAFVGSSLAMMLLAGAVAWAIARSIVHPLAVITREIGEVAQGNLTITISGIERTDELGGISKALAVFRSNGQDRLRLEAEQQQAEKRLEAERQQAMLSIADQFESKVGSIIHALGGTAQDMRQTATELQDTTDQASHLCASVASASSQALTNVGAVTSASQQLSTSISDIGRRLTEASSIAGGAVRHADDANRMVQDLNSAADKIGQVVGMITDIANQTNLLALNATIEAARAGDAGKGFAVVASEVKQLANQTAQATEQITQQIAEIQQETQATVKAIGEIATTIRRIDEIAVGISGAVAEQGIATHDISRNVEETSTGTEHVCRGIDEVNDAVQAADGAAHAVTGSANILADMAEDLERAMESMLRTIRAA